MMNTKTAFIILICTVAANCYGDGTVAVGNYRSGNFHGAPSSTRRVAFPVLRSARGNSYQVIRVVDYLVRTDATPTPPVQELPEEEYGLPSEEPLTTTTSTTAPTPTQTEGPYPPPGPVSHYGEPVRRAYILRQSSWSG